MAVPIGEDGRGYPAKVLGRIRARRFIPLGALSPTGTLIGRDAGASQVTDATDIGPMGVLRLRRRAPDERGLLGCVCHRAVWGSSRRVAW
jgi:hypothetical protein